MSYETLLVEARDGVATLTLNRPDARNALNQTMIRELGAALSALEASPEARVVVIRGAGERAFCAGADLRGMFRAGSPLDARAQYAGLARILETIPRMRAPVIAQVHGYALAGGCGLAAACDLVIAADDAVFGLPEVKLGLLPLMVLAPILRVALPRGAAGGTRRDRRRSREEARRAVTGDAGAGEGSLLPGARAPVLGSPRTPPGPPDDRGAVGGRAGGDRRVSGEAPRPLAGPLEH